MLAFTNGSNHPVSNGPAGFSDGSSVSSDCSASNGYENASNGHIGAFNRDSNGISDLFPVAAEDFLYLSECELKRINCLKLEEVYQWLAYYAAR